MILAGERISKERLSKCIGENLRSYLQSEGNGYEEAARGLSRSQCPAVARHFSERAAVASDDDIPQSICQASVIITATECTLCFLHVSSLPTLVPRYSRTFVQAVYSVILQRMNNRFM